MTARFFTKEQGLEAIRALGYDPDKDRIMSAVITAEDISVRRLQPRGEGKGFTIVEDRTIFKLNDVEPPQHRAPLGPLETSPGAG